MGICLIASNGNDFMVNWGHWTPIWRSVCAFQEFEVEDDADLTEEELDKLEPIKLLTSEKMELGHYNGGPEEMQDPNCWITEEEADRIAEKIRMTLDKGTLQEFHKQIYEENKEQYRNDYGKDYYPWNVKLMEEFCWFCEESGGFFIA